MCRNSIAIRIATVARIRWLRNLGNTRKKLTDESTHVDAAAVGQTMGVWLADDAGGARSSDGAGGAHTTPDQVISDGPKPSPLMGLVLVSD